MWSGPVSVAIYCYVGVNDFYLWKLLSIPRILTVQLPPTTTEVIPGGLEAFYDDGSTFAGDGNNHHQPTQQRTEDSAQEAESSTSLATAKPYDIENDNRSEVRDFFYPAENHALY